MMTNRQKAVRLRANGTTYQKIAKLLGISKQRVWQIVQGYSSPSSGYPKPITEIPKNWKPGLISKEGLGHLTGITYLAEIVRKRDNWTCQICKANWQRGSRRFDVHHLDPECESVTKYENYKKFNRMITLCHKCHLRLKHIRVVFKERKKEIVDNFGS